jgi:predicted thioesterase
VRYEVTSADTAEVVGSGDVPVLATPRLVAWMEAQTVAVAAARLSPGETTVGTAVRIDHLRATGVGGQVDVEARLVGPDGGRRLTFDVVATDSSGQVVARGQIERVVVDRARFLDSVASQGVDDEQAPTA